jgi:hypothetical protein
MDGGWVPAPTVRPLLSFPEREGGPAVRLVVGSYTPAILIDGFTAEAEGHLLPSAFFVTIGTIEGERPGSVFIFSEGARVPG